MRVREFEQYQILDFITNAFKEENTEYEICATEYHMFINIKHCNNQIVLSDYDFQIRYEDYPIVKISYDCMKDILNSLKMFIFLINK